jgi:hypothetical protein
MKVATARVNFAMGVGKSSSLSSPPLPPPMIGERGKWWEVGEGGWRGGRQNPLVIDPIHYSIIFLGVLRKVGGKLYQENSSSFLSWRNSSLEQPEEG